MENPATDINEQLAAAAFTKQSFVFDSVYAANSIIRYKRGRVRDHLQKYLKPGSRILELNSGTGEDAIWLAQQGYRVHATDISEGMLSVLKSKSAPELVERGLSFELCSFTQLAGLVRKGPYDHIFSNFAGLNCTDRLDLVLGSFSPLLKPGGLVTLVILPKFCLWETLLMFRGKFKTAFRRFFSAKGVAAKVEGEPFRCWYYNPGYVIKNLSPQFELVAIEGLCTIVPPSYIENFAENYPGVYEWLKKKENKYRSGWPWKYIGDYYIISLRKK